MKKLNILCFIDSLGSGGAQKQMALLASELSKLGNRVTLATYYDQEHFSYLLDGSGVECINLKKAGRFSLLPLVRLVRLIRKERFSVAVSFLDTPNMYLQLAGLLFPRLRIISSERNAIERRSVFTVVRMIMHLRSDVVTVNSDSAGSEIARRHPYLRNKIRVVYNGVDGRFFSGKRPALSTGRERVVAVGTIAQRKNPQALAKALAIANAGRSSPISVDWIGKQDESPEGRSAFQETCAILASTRQCSNWRWMGEKKDLHSRLIEYRAFILPSHYEGVSNAMCEALALGIPVLASSVCDHPKILAGAPDFCLFDPNSPEDIANSLRRAVSLQENQELRLSEWCQTRANKLFALVSYVDIYRKIMDGAVK